MSRVRELLAFGLLVYLATVFHQKPATPQILQVTAPPASQDVMRALLYLSASCPRTEKSVGNMSVSRSPGGGTHPGKWSVIPLKIHNSPTVKEHPGWKSFGDICCTPLCLTKHNIWRVISPFPDDSGCRDSPQVLHRTVTQWFVPSLRFVPA